MNLYYELQVLQVDLTGIPLPLPFPVRDCGAAAAGDPGRGVRLGDPAGGDGGAQFAGGGAGI